MTEPPPNPEDEIGVDPESESESEPGVWFDSESWSEPPPTRGVAGWVWVLMTVLVVAIIGVLVAGRVVHQRREPSSRATQTAADISSLNQSVQSLNVQLATVNRQTHDAVVVAQARAKAAQAKAKKKHTATSTDKAHG